MCSRPGVLCRSLTRPSYMIALAPRVSGTASDPSKFKVTSSTTTYYASFDSNSVFALGVGVVTAPHPAFDAYFRV
jgi:hypothetical protein